MTDKIIRELTDNEHKTKSLTGSENGIATWEYAKDNLMLCLQKKTDENIIKRDFLDLEMYIRVRIADEASYKVKRDMFPAISENEIFERALSDMKKDSVVRDLVEIIAEITQQNISDLESPEMIVVTNESGLFGSSAICNTDLLCKIANKHNSNLVILPSSIHESILYCDNNPDMEEYNSMVKAVNDEVVNPEDRLSDHAYFFNRETREITW